MESVDLNKIPVQETEGHTSKGNQLKWKLDNQWYKADHMGYEGLSEVLVSRLLHKAELKYPFVEYHLVEIAYKGQIFSERKPEADSTGETLSAEHRQEFGTELGRIFRSAGQNSIYGGTS